MSLFFWLSGLKRRLSPSANLPSTRSTRRSSRSSQPALRSATVRRTRRSSQSSQPAAYSVERLESRQLLSASAVGTEFQVNTYTTDRQETNSLGGSMAMDADGDFVVTWTSIGQDAASSYGVYAQRYNAAGVAQGGEFRVNTYTTSSQTASTVAMDADGDFVVTWSSYGQDGDGWGVYAQRYNAAGVAQGGEFRVNTTTADWQKFSKVAMDADGDWAMTSMRLGPPRHRKRTP